MIPNCRGGRLVSMLCTWRTGVVSGPLWGADGLSLVFSSRFYFPLSFLLPAFFQVPIAGAFNCPGRWGLDLGVCKVLLIRLILLPTAGL
ncbi:hypothetical protein VTN49DRAFT_5764 [Thermomyces lanuginosus]|uniref:uncharacterized protein n=1 Tax=Thermomyces lanuginosus TaxID=5541 RepID=UPI003742FDEB